MLHLEDCIQRLKIFKETGEERFGITRLGIFGSVARMEQGDDFLPRVYGNSINTINNLFYINLIIN